MAQAYYKKYYVPASMIVTLVGDVKASESDAGHREIFRPAARGAKAGNRFALSSPHRMRRELRSCTKPSQPIFIEGYHKPSAKDKDDAVYDALQDLMSNGRTSRLYRSLVRDKKIAAQTGGFQRIPGIQVSQYVCVLFPSRRPGTRHKRIATPSTRRSNA